MSLKEFLNKIFSIKIEESIYRSRSNHVVIRFLGLKFKIKTLNIEQKTEKKKNCVAIIDPNGIGDYIFARHYFKFFRQSKYKYSYLIYFAPNNYAKFVQEYDSSYFDEIIIYNKNPYEYADDLKKKLKNYQFSTVINLAGLTKFSNFSNGSKIKNKLIKLIKADEKIADVLLPNSNIETVKHKNLKKYTKLLYTKPGLFELDRRKQFFEQLLELSIPKEPLNIKPLFEFSQGNYVTISLMAMSDTRNYTKDKWIEVLNYIIKRLDKNKKIVFIGGTIDKEPTQKVIDQLSDKTRCINLCGLTDAALIPVILKNSDFLLSPETGTVHIAEAVGCKTVCLCCGAHYGRFLPHKNYVKYIFPKKFKKLILENNEKELKKYYFPKYKFSVSEIDTQDVIKKIEEIMVD